MMKNEGKKFEEDFKKSVPDCFFYYRFKDGTASWGGGDNVRFQAKNICDCMIMGSDFLYLLELKSFKGKSIPFGNIDYNNIVKMADATMHSHSPVRSMVLFNFRDLEETYIAEADEVVRFMEESTRKSIPVAWFRENWQSYSTPIGQTKKRTRYRYEVTDFIQ